MGHVGREIKLIISNNATISTSENISIYNKVEMLCVVNETKVKAHISLGKSTQIKTEVLLSVKSGNLILGENCAVGKRTDIICENAEVRIGNNVRIAAECFILTNNHNFDIKEIPIWQQGRTHKPVIIEDDVWIGRNVFILKGVTIGEGSIVAAATVVTKDVPPFSLAYGNPCRVKEGKYKIEDN